MSLSRVSFCIIKTIVRKAFLSNTHEQLLLNFKMMEFVGYLSHYLPKAFKQTKIISTFQILIFLKDIVTGVLFMFRWIFQNHDTEGIRFRVHSFSCDFFEFTKVMFAKVYETPLCKINSQKICESKTFSELSKKCLMYFSKKKKLSKFVFNWFL